MTFQKGESGNPQGRPPGATLAGKLRKAVDNDFDEIIEAVISKAKDGDMQAATRFFICQEPAFSCSKACGSYRSRVSLP